MYYDNHYKQQIRELFDRQNVDRQKQYELQTQNKALLAVIELKKNNRKGNNTIYGNWIFPEVWLEVTPSSPLVEFQVNTTNIHQISKLLL